MEANILDSAKVYFTKQFTRGGGTRRQDHGTRGNAAKGKDRWYNEWRFRLGEEEIVLFAQRKTLLRGGELEVD